MCYLSLILYDLYLSSEAAPPKIPSQLRHCTTVSMVNTIICGLKDNGSMELYYYTLVKQPQMLLCASAS